MLPRPADVSTRIRFFFTTKQAALTTFRGSHVETFQAGADDLYAAAVESAELTAADLADG